MTRNKKAPAIMTGASVLALLLTACAVPPPALEEQETASAVSRDEVSCLSLAAKTIAGTEITGAIHVKSGETIVDRPPFTLQAKSDFCRVSVMLSSGEGSAIQAEYWLPDNWNRKFYAVGGGGFNGGLDGAPLMLVDPVALGYAGAANDAGHPMAEGASWAHNQPARLADWGHLANRLSGEFGKDLLQAYYGAGQTRSYFEGCSNGGRDALILAQRYPEVFDGIIAGAPAAHWTPLMSSFVLNEAALKPHFSGDNANAKFSALHAAVLEQCDQIDGVRDGVLENPRTCTFDPSVLQCKEEQSDSCLSLDEVAALRKIYEGHQFNDGRQLYPGYRPGGENVNHGWRDQSDKAISLMGGEFYRWMVYGDPDWSVEGFDLETDIAVASERMDTIVDAADPDLGAFVNRGGKLLLWHGWNDTYIPADATISYYDAVTEQLGPGADEHVRLFMAPGVNHCFMGDGPSAFDKLAALDSWVETGDAPGRIIATKYDNDLFAWLGLPSKVVRTRPLCPWPKTARYKGQGSTDEAESFSCEPE